MGKRVLLADDSATIQRAFTMVFASSEVDPAGARSFDEAVASARKDRPDLVIADVNLGTRTGYDLCAAFKGDASLRSIPVYILSSNHAPFDDARARQVGADGNFIKPFDSQALIDKVLDALARPAAAPAPAVAPAPPSAPAPGPSTFTVGTRPSASAIPQVRQVPQSAPQRPPVVAPPVAVAPAPAPGVEIEIEDDYGEFTIERSGSAPRPAAAVVPAPAPAAGGSGLRPSLIPGAPPPAPGRPLISTPVSSRASSSSLPIPAAVRVPPAISTPVPTPPPVARPPVPNTPPMGRTIMGMPAILPQMMGGQQARTTPPVPAFTPSPFSAPPVMAPLAPAPTAPTNPISLPTAPAPAPIPAAIASRIDEKIAQIAARGPEFEAIAKLSREIIEQVVWEVVPELAEVIIRQEIDRLAKGAK